MANVDNVAPGLTNAYLRLCVFLEGVDRKLGTISVFLWASASRGWRAMIAYKLVKVYPLSYVENSPNDRTISPVDRDFPYRGNGRQFTIYNIEICYMW